MNVISSEAIKQSNYYSFLLKSLGSESFKVFALAGDASARKYFRVVHNNTSYVLMVWDAFVDNNNYPFLSVLNHFHSASVNVPKVINKSPAEGFVLLEDLGDLTLERKFWETVNHNEVMPYYELAIDELIKIHVHATNSNLKSTAKEIEFDVDKLVWEMNYALEHFLSKFLDNTFNAAESKTMSDAFIYIATKLANEPKVICHRDYHSRNLMFKLGKMYVIDFQDARLGPIQYDLVSLLKDSYVSLSSDMQKNLLNFYFEQSKEVGSEINQTRFFEIYPYQVVQRSFKACGSFASFYNTRSDTRYIKYIKQTLETFYPELECDKQLHDFKQIIENKVLTNDKYLDL